VIVVDDGSTDATANIVESLSAGHPELALHRLARNCGVSAARNAGIKLCKSPYVAFLDADDVWRPEKLASQLSVFRDGDERLGVVHSAYFLIDEQGRPVKSEFIHAPRLKGDILQNILFDDYVLSGSASSVLIKREVLSRAGGFDEQLYYAEDWDLWARLAAISYVDFTPDAVVGIRVHPRSAQRREQPDKQRRFFLQRLRAYNRWEQRYLEDEQFILRLRQECYVLLLGNGRSVSRIREFYSALESSDLRLARALFPSEGDLWKGLYIETAKRLYIKLLMLRGKIWRPIRKMIFWIPPKGTNAGA
jgi:glycosyltransferase involved in cell wall biosynthesis